MIERQFRQTIDRYDMVHHGDRVLLAVSGGPDSRALLALFCKVAPEMGLDLHVAHLNHGWRGAAADKDADFVRRLAIRHRLPVTVGQLDHSSSIKRQDRQSSREARARNLRNEFLRDTARQVGARRIALGHTRDDQAESFLLRLLRGSGSRGLSGTYPVVDDLFIRPLIEMRRQDLIAYLRDRRMRYRIDVTNRDLTLSRNRVRRRLLPLLERDFNPAVVEALAQAADILRDEDQYLSEIAEAAFSARARHRGGSVVLAANDLLKMPPALQRRLVRLAFKEVRGDLRRITLAHVEASLKLLEARPAGGRRKLDLPDGLTATLERNELHITRRPPHIHAVAIGSGRDAGEAGAERRNVACREALCPIPGEVLLPGFGMRMRATVVRREEVGDGLTSAGPGNAYLDADRMPGPLLIRPRRPGDRFLPLGAPGTRKVKAFLIDRKVPVDERGRTPLVLCGDRIAWVVGHQIDDHFKVTPNTRRVLVLEKEPR